MYSSTRSVCVEREREREIHGVTIVTTNESSTFHESSLHDTPELPGSKPRHFKMMIVDQCSTSQIPTKMNH